MAKILSISSVLCIWGLQGCGALQLNRGINEFQLFDETAEHLQRRMPESAEKPFVGLAISGGGSRSANFAAAIMEELDRYGFLSQVTAVSAVSGGTLPAAYYALNRNKADWSWEELRNLLRSNFYRRFLWKHFNPLGLFNYILTEYNRSDMMAEVFDDVLFHGATYNDLETSGSQLLINATELRFGRWTFTEDSMKYMNTALKSMPLARAVAASSAVPGIYNGIAVPRHKKDGTISDYIHLIDGGVSENLGLETLLDMYKRSISMPSSPSAGHSQRACFIFLIDAFTHFGPSMEAKQLLEQRDLRHGIDFIVDSNLIYALDLFSINARDRFMSTLIAWPLQHIEPPDYDIFYNKIDASFKCRLWHFNFRYLFHTFGKPESIRLSNDLGSVLPLIETHWKLRAPGNCSDAALQAALYDGGRILVRDHSGSRRRVKEWFEKHGLELSPKEKHESAYEFQSRFGGSAERDSKNELTGRVACSK